MSIEHDIQKLVEVPKNFISQLIYGETPPEEDTQMQEIVLNADLIWLGGLTYMEGSQTVATDLLPEDIESLTPESQEFLSPNETQAPKLRLTQEQKEGLVTITLACGYNRIFFRLDKINETFSGVYQKKNDSLWINSGVRMVDNSIDDLEAILEIGKEVAIKSIHGPGSS